MECCRWEWCILGDLRSPCAAVVVSLARRVIIGNAPGVLFLVTRRCIRGFSFSLCFAVGFRDCIIGGASVMRGMVSIGVLSTPFVVSLSPPFVHPLSPFVRPGQN